MSVRETILQAALEAFERDGLAGLSMRKIAAAVGLTPMALYRHFADKQALIDAITAEGLDAWARRVARIEAPAPVQWMARMMEAFLDFSLEQPHLYEAAFLLKARSARRYPDDFLAGRSPALNMMFQRIDAARAQGLVGDAPTAEIALSLWAMGQGLVDLRRAGRFMGGEAEFRTLYRAAQARCLSSFRPGAPSL